jgi:hypothetical protein
MSKVPGRLTTYCTNIHPADSWAETFAALRSHIPAVKAAVSPRAPFPIGLRLSSRAAAELTPEQDRCFRAWLAEENCFVPTINGFPFGSFHNDSIKEQVYGQNTASALPTSLPAGSRKAFRGQYRRSRSGSSKRGRGIPLTEAT